MSESNKKKVYGLIIPKKPGQDKSKSSAAVFNVFGEDQDSDEDVKTKGPVGPYGFTKTNSKLKLQNQMDIEKAMMEDPNVYEYDNIYDDIQASKPQLGKQEEMKSKKKSKPQYITGLLKAAEAKKKEQERRNERKVQKEREEEGEKYADKEAFVTSAYKQKMLERQKEEEEEMRKEQMEAMTDVTKQKDLGGFYRYLYRQTTGLEEENKDGPKNERIKEEPPDDFAPKKEPKSRKNQSGSSSSESDEPIHEKKSFLSKSEAQKYKEKSVTSQRQFRKRQVDSSSEDENEGDSHENINKTDGKRKRHSSEEQEYYSKRDSNNSRKHGNPPSSKGRSKRKSRSPSRTDHILDRDRKRKRNRRSLSSSPLPEVSSRQRQRSLLNGKRDKRSRSRSPTNKQVDSLSNEKVCPSSDGHYKENSEQEDTNRRDRNGDQAQSEKNESGKIMDRYDEQDKDSSSDDNNEGKATVLPNQNVKRPASGDKGKAAPAPIDPKDKVYPHHNSPKDIAEARKRYLMRKLEREKARGS